MKKSLPPRKKKKPAKQYFPKGWDQKRVQAVIDYYDNQTDEEGAAEYEAGMAINGQSMILVPTDLVPEIRKLIARRK
jgi:hypothetical protein